MPEHSAFEQQRGEYSWQCPALMSEAKRQDAVCGSSICDCAGRKRASRWSTKNARILWALMTREQDFDVRHSLQWPQAQPANAAQSPSTHQPAWPSISLVPQARRRRCIRPVGPEPVNSTNPTGRRSRPTPSNECSPVEPLVSRSAPSRGVTRPFLDVQSVLCSYAASPSTVVTDRTNRKSKPISAS